MIICVEQIDLRTDEGKLAIHLLARLTTLYDTALTPDEVIEKANSLSLFAMKGEEI